MTYSYVYHIRNLDPANLLRKLGLISTVVWCLLSREPLQILAKTLHCGTRVPELHDNCYSIGLSEFHFTVMQFSKAKKRCSRRALTRDPTVFNVSFLENPTEYPHKPYIARNQSTRLPAEDLRRWQYVFIFISFHAIIFRKLHGLRQSNRRENNANSHSRSFNVMHFGITEKPTTDRISRYNNLALSLKYPKNSQRKRRKLPFSTAPLSRTSAFNAVARGEPFQISGWTFYPEN